MEKNRIKNKFTFRRSKLISGNYTRNTYGIWNDVYEKLQHLSQEQQVTMSFIVNIALEEYFKEYDVPCDED